MPQFYLLLLQKNKKIIDDLLPEAFAVIKETAKRFKENSSLEVTATKMDIDLAARRESIEIKGDKAYWSNSWKAAGNIVNWDMVHYCCSSCGIWSSSSS